MLFSDDRLIIRHSVFVNIINVTYEPEHTVDCMKIKKMKVEQFHSG